MGLHTTWPLTRLSFQTSLALVATLLLGVAPPGSAQTTPASPGAATVAPVPLENFFQNPSIAAVQLSPDGKHLGMLVAIKGGRMQLAVMEIGGSTSKIIGAFPDADVVSFTWVSSDRLVMSTTDLQLATGEKLLLPGLYAVNRDGSLPRVLINSVRRTLNRTPSLTWNHQLHTVRPLLFPNEVFVTQFDPKPPHRPRALLRLNTLTGTYEKVSRDDANERGWLVGPDGAPRISVAVDKDLETVNFRDPASNAWRQIAQFNIYAPEAFDIVAYDTDGTLYVSARLGVDKKTLYKFDLANNRIDPAPLASLQNYDLNPQFVYTDQRIVGVRYLGKAPGTHWFDAGWKEIQASVNALLPSTINQLVISPDAQAKYLIVASGSDVQPPAFYLYDINKRTLALIGKSQPDIDPNRMAETELVRYKARDGLEVPAYLTLPQGVPAKNLPLVVLVHGGPYVRGVSWMWEAQSQFLASRGYAVLQPEFRGSTGYGAKHFTAGWKQWGLSMQDDVTDGTRWLIEQGIADPKRICIAGASYGGYATLMGLIREPGLYRCGVEWAGVTDIEMLYTVSWSDVSDETRLYFLPKLVGDRDRDAKQLKETSPIVQAARITQPLLMAYGESDQRVPIIHGTTLRDALQNHNKQVEWISYANEGHGWSLVRNRVDFWKRVEAFLDRHIGVSAGTDAAKRP